MIRKRTIIQHISASLCTALLLAGCSDEQLSVGGGDGTETAVENYLRLTVCYPEVGILTRSNPTGGEPGDGSEPGQDYETRIDDLMLLFYQGEEGVNSDASTPIDKIIYLDRDVMQGDNRTEPVPVGLPGGWYDLLVVTNTGNIRQQLQGKTLGGVRDYLQKQAWTESEGRYSRFVMSSSGHEDERVYLCGDNTKENPATATVEVERHAARIDYRTSASVFDVSDTKHGKAKVSVTGAVVLNKMAGGSYLLKRTALPADGGRLTDASPLTYLGDELPVGGGVQRNYVVDPWSLQKTSNPVNTRLVSLYDNYYASVGDSYAAWERLMKPGAKVGDWWRIDYTLENTMSREAQLDAYRTMVVFQARYTPAGFEAGKTFYRVKDELYPTLDKARAAASVSGAKVREYHDGLCYYVWHVRHSNDGKPGEAGIMEYGIVRNNVYRLLVSGIHGLGGEVPFPDPDDPDKPDPEEPDKPDPEEPDPGPDPEPGDPKNITVIVKVEPWTPLDQTDIYL